MLQRHGISSITERLQQWLIALEAREELLATSALLNATDSRSLHMRQKHMPSYASHNGTLHESAGHAPAWLSSAAGPASWLSFAWLVTTSLVQSMTRNLHQLPEHNIETVKHLPIDHEPFKLPTHEHIPNGKHLNSTKTSNGSAHSANGNGSIKNGNGHCAESDTDTTN